MAVIYGFSLYKSPTNSANLENFVIAGNNESFTPGDPLMMSGGFAVKLNNVTSGYAVLTAPVLGIAARTFSAGSNNQAATGSRIAIGFIPVDQSYTFLAGADGELSLTTHPGLFFSVSLLQTGSGQFVGALATSANALFAITTPLLCVGVDPLGEGTTGAGGGSRKGLFRFVRSQYNPNLTSST